MLRVKFVDSGEYRGYIYIHSVYGNIYCAGFYWQRENKIVIVRQQHILKIAYLLFHELGHWLLCKLKVKMRIHCYYDTIDGKICDKFFRPQRPANKT